MRICVFSVCVCVCCPLSVAAFATGRSPVQGVPPPVPEVHSFRLILKWKQSGGPEEEQASEPLN
jgi:hypothetical protein